MPRFCLFSLFLIILSTFSYGQIVQGHVTDVVGNPIIGANVTLVGSSIGTSTDNNGYFALDATPGGEIKITSIGFKTIKVSPSSLSVDAEIMLEEDLYQLPEIIVERETMTGGLSGVSSIPGSAHYLNQKILNKYSHTDINRILRNVAGVNIQEEDGFGLRPNIGMRGTGVERSSKITLMEDGILMAPAPYTAPSAYYFPSIGRIQGVEVRKGSSQIKYGPYTTGGAINLISTAIPKEFASKIAIHGGNYGRRTVHASVGQSFKYGGVLLETFQNSADGFKVLDNGGPTGFNNQDYLAKVRVNSPTGAKIYQALTFKVGQATGDSDETYLGLTRQDFESTPYRRYSASQLDNIKSEHTQYSIKYNILPFKFMDVSLTAYQNKFARNWYKLDKVKNNSGSKIGISTILDDPSLYAAEYSFITGSSSPNPDAMFVKANNRNYSSGGLQMVTGFNFRSKKLQHDIELGLRYHRDEEDRFQWEDAYQMANGSMMLTNAGTPGTESNRITNAKALASYVQYNLQIQNLTIMPGLRYENIDLTKIDYGKSDTLRLGVNLKESQNLTSAWIPGVSVEYDFSNLISGFVGMHRGFSPPGPSDGAKPEKSNNYELGVRLMKSGLLIQTIGFYNDYENLLGADMAASGGGGTGNLFNAGSASIYGLEAELNYRLPITLKGVAFPFSMAYTFTDGQFLSSFNAENEDWGAVTNGDRLPYLSNHQLTINAGAEHRFFDIQMSSKYNSAMRTSPGQGEIPTNVRIGSNFIIDMSANFRVTSYLTAFGSVNNLTNSVYVVAHRPAGLRPGMPRSFLVGLKMNL